MKYKYNVAGINVLCKLPFSLIIQEDSEEFLWSVSDKEKEEDYNFIMEYIACEELPGQKDDSISMNCAYYEELTDKWNIYYCPSPHGEPYACVTWKKNEKIIKCHYLHGQEHYLNYSRNITKHIGLETLMRANRGFLLHSSFIRWKEKGIIFSAPSGTGKSTQADLWEKFEGADVLNGDRSAIRKVNDEWIAYGLPYAGTSGIYRNESAKIEAIIVLRQAKENRIQKIGVKEAFGYLYPEITVHRWDKEFVEEIWDILMKLLTEVPVYLLECTPDQDAVRMLKNQLLSDRV